MARTPEQLAAKRLRDARYRENARAKAKALGLSPSAALGKPNKGEISKSAAGLDARTKAGRAAAEQKAQALGKPLPKRAPVQRAKTKAGIVVQSADPQQLVPVVNGIRGKKVDITVTLEDDDGNLTTVKPWGHGGISASELQKMMREAGGNLMEAILRAMETGKAAAYGGVRTLRVVEVSVVYMPAPRKRRPPKATP